ncbi:S1 family peptidase [Streptomyces sp. NPDC001393]
MKHAARPRWLAFALPAAALAAAVPFVIPPLAGASSVPATQPASRAATRIDERQQVLDAVADRITEGLSEPDRAHIPGFAEVEVDPDHNHLRLHWKGTPPQRVRQILAHLPHGVTAEVDSARYSKAELHAARMKLLNNLASMKLRAEGTAAPVRVTSIAPAVDGSGLEVGYDNAAGTASRLLASGHSRTLQQVATAAGRLAGVHVAAIHRLQSVDLSSRQHDSSPWTGASALKNPLGGICSGSYGVKNAQGQYMLTSAYHCGPGPEGRWTTWWGGDLIGTTDAAQRSPQDDVVGIKLPSQRVSGRLYDGPASRTDGYAKPVTGWGHNNVGDYVCTDGANGGVHCGVRIAQTDIGVTGPNGIYRPDVDLAYATSATPGGVAAVNGDSGGPVFASVRNHTADEARGIITALDRTLTCPPAYNPDTVLDGHRRKPWCLAGVYYVPIGQTLHDMHWTLVTG